MKVITRDSVQSDIEKKKKLDDSNYRIARESYLDKLKSSRKFQKYVVEDILLKAANDLNDLSQIPNSAFSNLEEVGKIILSTQIAHKKLKSIIGQLV
jgi:hypothetical protein